MIGWWSQDDDQKGRSNGKAKLGSLLFHAMHGCRSLEDVDQKVEPWSQLRWPEKPATIVFVSFKDDLRKGMALFGYSMHIPNRRCSNLFNGRAQGNQGKRGCNHSDRNGTRQTRNCVSLWLVFQT